MLTRRKRLRRPPLCPWLTSMPRSRPKRARSRLLRRTSRRKFVFLLPVEANLQPLTDPASIPASLYTLLLGGLILAALLARRAGAVTLTILALVTQD